MDTKRSYSEESSGLWKYTMLGHFEEYVSLATTIKLDQALCPVFLI